MATATDVPSANLQALIRAAAGGDHAAFAQIYQRTHVHLFGVAVRMLGQGQAAEDVLQEAYVSIWKNAGSYRSEVGGQPIQPMTWLIAIVRNKALDSLDDDRSSDLVDVAAARRGAAALACDADDDIENELLV